jgi:hypothetical protein
VIRPGTTVVVVAGDALTHAAFCIPLRAAGCHVLPVFSTQEAARLLRGIAADAVLIHSAFGAAFEGAFGVVKTQGGGFEPTPWIVLERGSMAAAALDALLAATASRGEPALPCAAAN